MIRKHSYDATNDFLTQKIRKHSYKNDGRQINNMIMYL